MSEITFTLTGQRGVFKRLYDEEPSIERIVRHVPISVLSLDESRHVLTFAAEHADTPFGIGSEAQDPILALATGHPYAVHLLGNAAFGNMEDHTRMTRDDVLRGIGDVLRSDKSEKYVLQLRDVSDNERLILTSMALYTSGEIPVHVPSGWIGNHLLGAVSDQQMVADALDALVAKNYLVEGPKAEGYRFRDELFRVFLSQFVFAHREREEERLARRRESLDLVIGKERRRDDMKRLLRDYREHYRSLYPDQPPMLEYHARTS